MKRNIFFFYDNKKKLFKVKDKKREIFFPTKLRGMQTYCYGIKKRAIALGNNYSLDLIDFKKNDIIIDCGANFGDIYNWFYYKQLKINYISFEPAPDEFKCIEFNCKGKENYNMALSNKNSYLKFYLKSDTGDSSLIRPANGYSKIVKVKTLTLNKFFTNRNFKNVKLLKVEAEGYEPEILQGSLKILKYVKYIAVDGTPERGINNDSTIDFAINFLKSNNFELISLKNNNYVGLFKNKKY